jgi:ADP-ribose pyrophosphatase YjhB (NUDIX family)
MSRHTSDHIAIDIVAIALLRREDNIVIILQKTGNDTPPCWLLPGGLVEAGELITEGLRREVLEEAGVQVAAFSHLACFMQLDRPAHRAQVLAYFFEATEWTGELGGADPDDEILDVQLVPLAEAITRIEKNNAWPCMKRPLLTYLREECIAGAHWLFREDAEGQHLIEVV